MKKKMIVIVSILWMIILIGIKNDMVNAETVEKTCGYYTYVEDEKGAWIVGYDDGKDYYETEDENLTWNIPSTLDGLKVIGIGDYFGEDYETDCSLGIKYYVSKITLPDTLLYIGRNAFSETDKLESIIVPAGLREIDSWAFWNCKNLKNIIIPEGLTHIGAHAFDGCNSLEKISIPSSVTYIGNYAFFDCWSATGIYVADGNSYYFDLEGVLCTYKYIDENGNPYSTEIDVITYPGGKNGTFNIESNMYVDETTFVNAKSLNSISVVSEHTDYSSADGILYNKDKTEIKICPCAKTGTITIPDTVKKIGYSAFSYSRATEIVIPDSVTFVDSYAFYNCKELEKITIGKNLINRQEEYYYNNSADLLLEELTDSNNLTTIIVSNDNPYMKAVDNIVYNSDMTKLLLYPIGKSGAYVMPDTVVSVPASTFFRVSEITLGAAFEFTSPLYEYENTKIKNYYVSEKNLNYTAKDGWLYSKDMTELLLCPNGKSGMYIMPDTVVSVPKTIFCKGFNEITLGAAFEFSDEAYEYENTSITKYYVSDMNENYVAKDGWLYSKDMKIIYKFPIDMGGDVIIPNGVNRICDGERIVDFIGTMIIPESVTEIDMNTWYIDMEDYTMTIYGYKGSYAEKFAAKYNVPFVALNTNNEKQKEIMNEQTVPVVGTQVIIGNGEYKVTKTTPSEKEVTYIKPINKNKTSITIPVSITFDSHTYKVTSIAPDALANNKKLTKVTVGKNITSIGKNAFKNCKKLKSVTLKSTTLKSIGSNAFYGDKNLKTITIKSTKLTSKSVGKNAFKGTNKKLTIKVPKKKVSSYKKFLGKKGNKNVKVKK